MITNNSDISLALAVWLLHDDYDYISDQNYISATSLMKPLRHIILGSRVDRAEQPIDLADLIARAMGNALHDSVEKAWTRSYPRALKLLGYTADVIGRVKVNPSDADVLASNSIIPVYLEQRITRTFQGHVIGGKYDMVTDGIIQDAKSTSAFTWLYGGRDEDYQLQMSIYRWLDAAQPLPKIKEDFGRINFIFTDWQKFAAKTNPNYPQKRVEYKEIPLLSLKDTETWIQNKLTLIQKHKNTPEDRLPECSDEDLWLSDPSFKYYGDPAKTAGRSTKNFTSLSEANAFRAEKGKGVVLTVQGPPKRCGYCEAFSICTQRRKYFPE